MKKYSNQKTPNQPFQMMNLGTIKSICKKILLALQFIYSKGLFFGSLKSDEKNQLFKKKFMPNSFIGHLHSGNVLIDGNKVKLTDLPNRYIASVKTVNLMKVKII